MRSGPSSHHSRGVRPAETSASGPERPNHWMRWRLSDCASQWFGHFGARGGGLSVPLRRVSGGSFQCPDRILLEQRRVYENSMGAMKSIRLSQVGADWANVRPPRDAPDRSSRQPLRDEKPVLALGVERWSQALGQRDGRLPTVAVILNVPPGGKESLRVGPGDDTLAVEAERLGENIEAARECGRHVR